MVKHPINIGQRSQQLNQRVEGQLKRCISLAAEADALVKDQRSAERRGNGLFCSDLITEAQTKLVECQLVAGNFTNLGEDATVKLAITERWVNTAVDLLNQAQMVLDDRKDIWGNNMPTGGLYDK